VPAGWQLAVGPQLVDAASLGSARRVLVDAALLRIEPGPRPTGTPFVPMSITAVVATLVLWPLAAALLGAWRASTRDT
jgi:hypothetical protein